MKARTMGGLAWSAGLALAACVACSSPPSDGRIGVTAPDSGRFEPVGRLLDHRCGSLDCHGSAVRNLRIYGCEGLRLSAMDNPRCRSAGGTDTTAAELDATYRSLVGLEPAVMSEVVQGKGEHPELLTFVRKARGTESHKGGTLIAPGDAQDTCIATWLGGQTDVAACARAVSETP